MIISRSTYSYLSVMLIAPSSSFGYFDMKVFAQSITMTRLFIVTVQYVHNENYRTSTNIGLLKIK